MATLPAHIRDQVYQFALNFLHGTRVNQGQNIYRSIGAAILRGTDYTAMAYNADILNIVRSARGSVASANAGEAFPGVAIPIDRIPIDYGLDRGSGQIRYRVRVIATGGEGGTRFNVIVPITSTTELTAEEIHQQAIDCMRTQACGPPPPSWLPVSTASYTSHVVSMGRAAPLPAIG